MLENNKQNLPLPSVHHSSPSHFVREGVTLLLGAGRGGSMRDFGRAAVSLELPAAPAAPCFWKREGGHFGTDRQHTGHPACTYGPVVLS